MNEIARLVDEYAARRGWTPTTVASLLAEFISEYVPEGERRLREHLDGIVALEDAI